MAIKRIGYKLAIFIPAFPYVWFQDSGVATSSSHPAVGACVSLYIYCSTLVCIYFYMHISMVTPYTICEAKKKDNSNNYNI